MVVEALPYRPREDETVQYIMLIYSDPAAEPAEGTPEQAQMMAGYGAFGQEAEKRGLMRGGERLRPTANARTVRVRNGKTVTVDGPFAETKEQLGGYYILDCKSEAEAIEMAAKIPGARYGSIEVRPIWAMGG